MEYLISQCCVCLELASNAEKVTKRDSKNNQWITKLQNVVPEVVWMGHYTICKSCTYSLDVAFEFRALCGRLQNLRTKTLHPDDSALHNARFLDTDHPYARCPQTIRIGENIKPEKTPIQEQPEAEPPEDTKIDIQPVELPEEMKIEVVHSPPDIKTEPMELSDTDADDLTQDQFSAQTCDLQTAQEVVEPSTDELLKAYNRTFTPSGESKEKKASESDEHTRAPTPPELRGERVASELLPAKSKQRYERCYQVFEKWCNEKNVVTYTENVLLAYFSELVSQNKKSLWALYSMLKCCILIHKNIDISRYNKLSAYLKRKTANFVPKKSRILEEKHINSFIDEADDNIYLLMKVALIIGVSGGLRREELYKMVVRDVEFESEIVVVTIPETKMNAGRQFAITNCKWVALIRKYVQIRLTACRVKDPFFVKYQNGRCVNLPVGINTIGSIPSKIAHFLKLEGCREYTGHCFRRTSATLFANRGDLLTKNHAGWKSCGGLCQTFLKTRT